jgi:hypothetical protein
VIDSTIALSERSFVVTGVLGKDVVFPTAADVYTARAPLASDAMNYASRRYGAFARIKPGASFAGASAEVSAIGTQLSRESPKTTAAGCCARVRSPRFTPTTCQFWFRSRRRVRCWCFSPLA